MYAACGFEAQDAKEESRAIDICRLLLNSGTSHSDPLIDQRRYIRWFHGSASLFDFSNNKCTLHTTKLPLQMRFEVLSVIPYWLKKSEADTFRLALGCSALTKEIDTFQDSQSLTVLHHVAHALRETNHVWLKRSCWLLGNKLQRVSYHAVCYNTNQCGWNEILREAITEASLLHATDLIGRTPLCVLLHDFDTFWLYHKPLLSQHRIISKKVIQVLSCTLYAWLYDLQASGVDLQDYGKQETDLNLKDKVYSERCIYCEE